MLDEASGFNERGVRTIIDVGCGSGIILHDLSFRGFDVVGTEVCTHLLETRLKNDLVYPLALNSFDDVTRHHEDGFDVVIMCDFLDELASRKEVRKALSYAANWAQKGVVITCGGAGPMKRIKESLTWWVSEIYTVIREDFDEFAPRLYQNADRVLFSAWKGR